MYKFTTTVMLVVVFCMGIFQGASAAQGDLDWEIISVDGRVTEQNDTWWRFAYIVEIENRGDYDMAFDLTVQFLDADGFIVDDDNDYNLRIDARSTAQFTGYDLVTASVAGDVVSVNALVEILDSAYVAPPVEPSAEPATPLTEETPVEPKSEVTPRRVILPLAFIRSAPGADGDLVGAAGFHQLVYTIGLSDDGDWYELDGGSWIHRTALER